VQAVAMHIKADGSIDIVQPKHGKEFTLQELQGFVGGHIELVPITPGVYGLVTITDQDLMFCNEEGKLQGLPHNLTASVMSQYFPNDFVVGNVIVVNRKQVD
jgi:Domain of unknown function (DUF3846)